jgi:hypothetical protein
MQNQEWIKTLEDGRKVKFTWETMHENVAFVTAQIAANPVVYSIMLAKANRPLRCEDVEGHFAAEPMPKESHCVEFSATKHTKVGQLQK